MWWWKCVKMGNLGGTGSVCDYGDHVDHFVMLCVRWSFESLVVFVKDSILRNKPMDEHQRRENPAVEVRVFHRRRRDSVSNHLTISGAKLLQSPHKLG